MSIIELYENKFFLAPLKMRNGGDAVRETAITHIHQLFWRRTRFSFQTVLSHFLRHFCVFCVFLRFLRYFCVFSVFYKLSCHNEEVNCTESFPSISFPWQNHSPCQHYQPSHWTNTKDELPVPTIQSQNVINICLWTYKSIRGHIRNTLFSS
jgi:hypothetical protein